VHILEYVLTISLEIQSRIESLVRILMMVAALRIVVVVMFVVVDVVVVVVVVLLLEQIIHDMVKQNMWIALILSRYRQKARSSLLLLTRQLMLLVLRLQMRMLMLRLLKHF